MNLITGEVFAGVDQLLIDPMLTETTTFEVTITDPLTGHAIQKQVTVLVSANPVFDDLNGDGCNTPADLHMVLPDWNQANTDDANGDGSLNLLDYLYIQHVRILRCQLKIGSRRRFLILERNNE